VIVGVARFPPVRRQQERNSFGVDRGEGKRSGGNHDVLLLEFQRFLDEEKGVGGGLELLGFVVEGKS